MNGYREVSPNTFAARLTSAGSTPRFQKHVGGPEGYTKSYVPTADLPADMEIASVTVVVTLRPKHRIG